ncbi:MAG: sigma-54-dependent Fis family transcriptional regulator [Burkholderiales bacterium]|nr:sigma-54-dependent Fis family transcriptional regulator [Burkholderiales bacterium]MDE2394376.1 sigma-54-dependent Fis family transcriptional regulator [Burkholderiales bacterium]MDE2454287.1 sigma-54-dependent Fis family transcriptional regulator [Burkholderiales bacterium]
MQSSSASPEAALREPWLLPPADRADALIARSQRRSLDLHRLDPAQGSPRVLTAGSLRVHREPLEPLLEVARSGMESLYLQIRDAGYVVLLTDAEGVAVEFIDNPAVEREARRAGLARGGCWTEDQEGTCAVGLALIDRLPFTVHHGEHFRVSNGLLTCSAAPIFTADGRLNAVLDASALHSPGDKRSQQLVLMLVHQAARMIENAYFLRQFERHLVLRTSSRREFLEVTTEGLIAFDAGGRVVAANPRFLHDMGRSPASLIGAGVEDLFGLRYEALAAAAKASEGPLRLRLAHSGSECFALARAPRPTRPAARPTSRAAAPGTGQSLEELAGADPRMQEAARKARRVIDKPVAVLLQGESGTGKEAFAKAMHGASVRAAAAFIALNCAAIPETLIESELFGHGPGAFTGAQARGSRGKIAQAHGGTLFLDEIGDMPLALQTRLLRVLAEGEVTPLGSERAQQVDLQVICATHRRLDGLVASGQFRLDLYHRLNGITLTLPPLRERSDLEALIESVLALEARACAAPAPALSRRARELLLAHAWPGNIRELKNVLRAALLLCESGEIEPEHLAADIGACAAPGPWPGRQDPQAWHGPAAQDPAATSAGQALRLVLQQHQWRISDAARSLEVSRSTVYRRMARYGIVEPNRQH